MAVKLDRNTVIPIGFAIVILGGAISIAYFAGGFFERLAKFDPVRLEVRLYAVETSVTDLGKKIDRLENRKVDLFFHQNVTKQSAAAGSEQKDANKNQYDLRHGDSTRLLTR